VGVVVVRKRCEGVGGGVFSINHRTRCALIACIAMCNCSCLFVVFGYP